MNTLNPKASFSKTGALTLALVASLGACAQISPNMKADAKAEPSSAVYAARHQAHMQKHQARWLQADTDKDGAISKAEAQAAGHHGMVRHFDALDSNKDGKVTPQEARAAMQAKRQAHHHARHVSSDNKDSKDAKDRMHYKSPDQRRAAMQARFDQADTNKDSGLSKAELQAANLPQLITRFDSIDANKDGKITSEEIRAAWSNRGEHSGSHRHH